MKIMGRSERLGECKQDPHSACLLQAEGLRGRRCQCCSQPFPCRCHGTLGCSQFSQHSSCPVPAPAHIHRLGCSWQSPDSKLNPWLELKWQNTALKYSLGTLLFECLQTQGGASMRGKPWPCFWNATTHSPLTWLTTTQHFQGNKILSFLSMAAAGDQD